MTLGNTDYSIALLLRSRIVSDSQDIPPGIDSWLEHNVYNFGIQLTRSVENRAHANAKWSDNHSIKNTSFDISHGLLSKCKTNIRLENYCSNEHNNVEKSNLHFPHINQDVITQTIKVTVCLIWPIPFISQLITRLVLTCLAWLQLLA